MGNEKTLYCCNGGAAPTVLLSERVRQFAGANPFEQSRKRFAQMRGFFRYLGADDDEKDNHECEQKSVDPCDGQTTPSSEDFFQMFHQRAHQVREEDGEKEGDQSVARNVKKAQPQRKQQHCDQDSSGA
jgi:hypothetical protein